MNFAYANLINQSFEGRDLQNEVFVGASLQGANFAGADLRGANLSGANLRGITLTLNCTTFEGLTVDRMQLMTMLYLLTKTKLTPDHALSNKSIKRVQKTLETPGCTVHDLLRSLMSVSERTYLAVLFGEI